MLGLGTNFTGPGKSSLLMIELNEFDPAYLRQMAERLDLKNTQRALGLTQSTSTTADVVEHRQADVSASPANRRVNRSGTRSPKAEPHVWLR
jgi:hypothetical protein